MGSLENLLWPKGHTTPINLRKGVSSHCTKKEPQALYALGASPELCLNLGF
jgi:hypothetical protein